METSDDTFFGATFESEADWQQWRAAGIGASDVAKAHTRSYGWSPALVVAEKLGHYAQPVDEDMQDRFDYGHDMEPVLEDTLTALTGLTVVGQQEGCVHAIDPRLRCTIDGAAYDPETDTWYVVEFKTSRAHRLNWEYFDTQVQFQMAVTEVAKALVVVLWDRPEYDRTDVLVKEYSYDVVTANEVLSLGAEIADAVGNEDLHYFPTESVNEAKALYPVGDDEEVYEIDLGDSQVIAELRAANEAMKPAKEAFDTAKGVLAGLMAEATVATLGDEVVATWKNQTSNRFDTKAFKADHPDLYEEYMRESTTRTFRIK